MLTQLTSFGAGAVRAAGRPAGAQFSLTLRPRPGETLPALARRLVAALRERDATLLHLLGYGRTTAWAGLQDALKHQGVRAAWPVTWVEGAPGFHHPVAGLHLRGFTGGVDRVKCDGRVVGSIFTDGGARQCLLGGLTPADPTLSPSLQTGRVLDLLQNLLASAGFELADMVRTWFFLEDILAWYRDFNRERTQVYGGVKFRTGSLPASTGVGAKNPAGAALALAAWAFQPVEDQARAEEVASPRQCPAPAYGSSFSRALELGSDAGRRLLISGTASIAPGGETQWVGDVRRQVDLTMDVVGAILESRGFTLADLSQATAYFRRPADARVFTEWLAAHRLAALPVISAQCDVCRDDLLFELEAEAATAT
jgi:enamine deaminase RidA (YjgF/YER057c/UK114 family)